MTVAIPSEHHNISHNRGGWSILVFLGGTTAEAAAPLLVLQKVRIPADGGKFSSNNQSKSAIH